MEHTTDERITLNPAYSLRELRILTGKTTLNNTISEIELKTKLCRKGDGFFCLNMPLISAAMQAVSGKEMAISLAQCGGISVIPCSIPVDEQVKIIKDVKRHKAGFQEEVVCFSPESKISDVIDTIHNTGYSIYPVTDNGMCNGKLIGIITDKDFHPVNHKDNTVSDHMITDLDVAEEGITLDEANEKMIKFRRGFLPLVDKDFNLKAVVFRKDIDKKLNFPNELVDEKNRYCIAAAVSTQPKDYPRIDALIKARTEVIFIDASDGYSDFQISTLDYIRTKSDIPVVGGNVITAEGFMHLAKAGFDAVKVGMGIGSGCTTQETKGTGRGQATALMDIVKARNEFQKQTGNYIPIIADGGISNTSHMAVALAIGADAIMMGRYFVQYRESAAPLHRHPKHGFVKEYWMEASKRARNYGRYDSSKDIFFEEGTEGYVPCVGTIHESKNIPETLLKIKSSMSSAGCRTVDEMHKNCKLELQSVYSLADGAVHDIIVK